MADGGQAASSNATSLAALDEDINVWGGGDTWGNDNLWNSNEFMFSDIDLHALGRKFDLEFYDDGNIEGPVQLNYWSLWGYVEDRR